MSVCVHGEGGGGVGCMCTCVRTEVNDPPSFMFTERITRRYFSRNYNKFEKASQVMSSKK